MTKRMSEYFMPSKESREKSYGRIPAKLYKQERDWTCAIACIRTMLSAFDEEKEEAWYIEKYNLAPGPHFSKDIKRIGILDDYDAVFGCDEQEKTMDKILDLSKDGYYIMLESMYNFSHWMVFVGYFSVRGAANIEEHRMLLYDPYLDSMRLVSAEEFEGMWMDGNHKDNGVYRDFIAVRK